MTWGFMDAKWSSIWCRIHRSKPSSQRPAVLQNRGAEKGEGGSGLTPKKLMPSLVGRQALTAPQVTRSTVEVAEESCRFWHPRQGAINLECVLVG